MSNFYIILLILVATFTLDTYREICIPKYDVKTDKELTLYGYLAFLMFVFYALIYYWFLPKHNFWLFLVYLFCGIDLMCKSADILFHLYVKYKKTKMEKEAIVVNKPKKSNKRKTK